MKGWNGKRRQRKEEGKDENNKKRKGGLKRKGRKSERVNEIF